MKIDDVIEKRDQIKKIYEDRSKMKLTVIMILIFMVSTILTVAFSGSMTLINFMGITLGNIFLYLPSYLMFYVHLEEKSKTNMNKGIDKWSIDYVKPFIESLDIKKNKVLYLKIENQINAYPVPDGISFVDYYTRDGLAPKTFLTVAYEDNGFETLTDWFEVMNVLEEDEEPFMECNHLYESLGFGINEGLYNAVIYVPKNYKFS